MAANRSPLTFKLKKYETPTFINENKEATINEITVATNRNSLQVVMEVRSKSIKLNNTVEKFDPENDTPETLKSIKNKLDGSVQFDAKKNEVYVIKRYIFLTQKQMLDTISTIEENEKNHFDNETKKYLNEIAVKLKPTTFKEDILKIFYDYSEMMRLCGKDENKLREIIHSNSLLDRLNKYVESLASDQVIRFYLWFIDDCAPKISELLGKHSDIINPAYNILISKQVSDYKSDFKTLLDTKNVTPTMQNNKKKESPKPSSNKSVHFSLPSQDSETKDENKDPESKPSSNNSN